MARNGGLPDQFTEGIKILQEIAIASGIIVHTITDAYNLIQRIIHGDPTVIIPESVAPRELASASVDESFASYVRQMAGNLKAEGATEANVMYHVNKFVDDIVSEVYDHEPQDVQTPERGQQEDVPGSGATQA